MTFARRCPERCIGPPSCQGVGGRMRGVTLIELLISIFILAILITVAVPAFREASLSARLTASANKLHSSVMVARSEAIKANAPTTLCTSTDFTTCATSGSWEQGWIILDANNRVILTEPAQPTGYKIIQSGTLSALTFQPIGVGATAATFKVCRSSPVGNQERIVTVTATGVAYVTNPNPASGSCS